MLLACAIRTWSVDIISRLRIWQSLVWYLSPEQNRNADYPDDSGR